MNARPIEIAWSITKPGRARLDLSKLLLIPGALLGGIVLVLLFINATTQPLVDFAAYRVGAGAILHAQRLYASALAWRDLSFAPLYPQPMPTAEFPYVYPPGFAVAMTPLLFLPAGVATAAWLLFVLGCVFGASLVLVDLLFQGTRSNQILLALGLTGLVGIFQPIRSILVTGQADSLLILLSALMLADFARRRDAKAALWLALAVAIKPTLGVLAIVFLWKRAYRPCAIFVLASIPLLILPFAFAGGIPALFDYATVLGYWSSPAFAVSPVNQSPYGLLLRFFTVNAFTRPLFDAPVLATIFRYALVVATVGVLAGAVRRTRELPVRQLALEFGLVLIGMLVAGPLSEAGNYGLLVIPLIALTAILSSRESRAWKFWRLAAGALILVYGFLSLPSLMTLDMGFYAYWQAPIAAPWLFLTGSHIYGLAAFAAVTLWVLRTYRSEQWK